MPSGIDSEVEYWGNSSQDREMTRIVSILDSPTDAEPSAKNICASPAMQRKVSSSKRHVDKAVGTGPSRTRAAIKAIHGTPSKGKRVLSRYSSEDSIIPAGTIETESDSSQPQSKQPSFAFSLGADSRRTSMTSLSSTTSTDASITRKRTLEYVDTFSGRSSMTSPASKLRRTSRQARTSPQCPEPSTLHMPQTSRKPQFPLPTNIPDLFSTSDVVPSPTKPSTVSSERSFLSKTRNMISKIGRGETSASANGQIRDLCVDCPSSSGALVIIAHSKEVQEKMDSRQITWGVQYEIARGVSHGWWTWDEITPKILDSLRGLNKDAANKVSATILSKDIPKRVAHADLPLWMELDREEAAIMENKGRGLGLHGEWQGDPKWYGGKIQQIVRLVEAEKGSSRPYRLFLEKMQKRKSNRFARFLGSRRVLQISIPKKLLHENIEALRSFLAQNFILCGRVFVAIGAKDGKVYLMEINQDHERKADTVGDQFRMSLEEFVDWHNPLSLNSKQPSTKWATRFDLGLSVSVPVLRFEPDQFFDLIDEVAPYDDSLGKAPTENIFTDGCGFMNGAALTLIGKLLGLPERSTAVQGRIAGAKGLWLLHPTDQSPTAQPAIWTRPSQQKIKLPVLGPAHLIFDQVAPARVTIPSRLSRLTIMNLSHNGVSTDIFVSMMTEVLKKEIDALVRWEGPNAMFLLWNTVNRLGFVLGQKLQRRMAGSLRALGFGREREPDESELSDSDDIECDTSRDEFSGEPLTIHAAVLELLQAGFEPLQLWTLYDKLQTIVRMTIDDIIKDFHITVPQSAEAFIVPDPYGVLEEGEIHFRSSQNLKDPLEDLCPNIITGDVLVYRNPARVPSDVQKVTAVEHPMLAAYTNVIVFPTKGSRSLASMLAGGDVDGDVCVCIWDPAIVSQFKNAPLYNPSDDFLPANFESQDSIETVASLHDRMNASADPDTRRSVLQSVLLSDLSDSKVGAYSVYHEISVYMKGYDHKDTLRNAFMFATVLDARKTGLKVKADVFTSDKRDYDLPKPLCLQGKDDTAASDEYGHRPPVKRDVNRPFVLDELLEAGRDLGKQYRAKYANLWPDALDRDRDADITLREPLRSAETIAAEVTDSRLKEELRSIRNHVEQHYQRWITISRSKAQASPSKKSPSKAASRSPSSKVGAASSQTAQYQDLARSFASGPADVPLFRRLNSLDAIMASHAYHRSSKFAFHVAFHAVCSIKARAEGSGAFTRKFAEMMAIPSSAVRVLEQCRSD
ncbi:putative RNA-dependent RNA polymerase SHL2 [Grifola frondosa]|uniref:RNA-dependent RNA polymerase n=1 Tax=Grifola frondosa TaxID=5627 RepID=A0A1C7LWU2_GRIFR|nr:putative RNA-dependent RNA polymerase SHL2 [Grifola frondosa]